MDGLGFVIYFFNSFQKGPEHRNPVLEDQQHRLQRETNGTDRERDDLWKDPTSLFLHPRYNLPLPPSHSFIQNSKTITLFLLKNKKEHRRLRSCLRFKPSSLHPRHTTPPPRTTARPTPPTKRPPPAPVLRKRRYPTEADRSALVHRSSLP